MKQAYQIKIEKRDNRDIIKNQVNQVAELKINLIILIS